MIHLVEAERASRVDELLRQAMAESHFLPRIVGVAEGALLVLIVGRSYDMSVASVETPESLQRFADGISDILRRALGDPSYRREITRSAG
jgi:hypothetical protein